MKGVVSMNIQEQQNKMVSDVKQINNEIHDLELKVNDLVNKRRDLLKNCNHTNEKGDSAISYIEQACTICWKNFFK